MLPASTTTALIIRPNHAPEIRVLECDGPRFHVNINRCPGSYLPQAYFTYEQFTALPDHDKFPRDPNIHEIEFNNARRIYRLIENSENEAFGFLSKRHLREIRARLKMLQPHCDQPL